ncbi:hypothetical protein JOB18_041013 [Solea senegalensis]|uniref:Uncharacterized protein n=1 Tax=Solea senegalensis TaxID=28829 RepID=A0AAV6S7J1_SOLSE|nr:hypothetical protein JOB18_041013 [Solea senegalensis]
MFLKVSPITKAVTPNCFPNHHQQAEQEGVRGNGIIPRTVISFNRGDSMTVLTGAGDLDSGFGLTNDTFSLCQG